MSNQERHDGGKPALHYWYSNLETAALAGCDGSHLEGYQAEHALTDLTVFLGGGSAEILREVVAGLLALADDALPTSRFYLLDRGTRRGVQAYCDVCVYGATKYARGNYRLGQSYCHYLDSALGHLQRMATHGADVCDAESEQFDLGHALWNIVQVLEQPSWRDDRLPAIVMTKPTTEEK